MPLFPALNIQQPVNELRWNMAHFYAVFYELFYNIAGRTIYIYILVINMKQLCGALQFIQWILQWFVGKGCYIMLITLWNGPQAAILFCDLRGSEHLTSIIRQVGTNIYAAENSLLDILPGERRQVFLCSLNLPQSTLNIWKKKIITTS